MKEPSVTPSNILLDAVIKGLDDVKGHEIAIIDLSAIENAISSKTRFMHCIVGLKKCLDYDIIWEIQNDILLSP